MGYTVEYDSKSHWSVITQRAGSKWKEVLPYCIANVALMFLLDEISTIYPDLKYYIEFSNDGHELVGLVISFLVVARVSNALTAYFSQRDCLDAMYHQARELIQNMVIFSSRSTDHSAKEWRLETTYRTLLLLRTAMAVVDYPDTKMAAWNVPELSGFEANDIKNNTFMSPQVRRWAHQKRNTWEESMRVPVRMAFLLRKTIHSQSSRLNHPLDESVLMGNVSSFMYGYGGMRKHMTMPVPFPLIQMERTFLFFYVFTAPFVMLNDDSSGLALCLAIFLMTYGFIGLEIVAIDLDDPFGSDANDFDNMASATCVFEDAYLAIRDVDGEEWVDRLRQKMNEEASEAGQVDEYAWLLTDTRP